MSILQIFKKKKTISPDCNPEQSGLSDLPPIPDQLPSEDISNIDSTVSGTDLSDSSSSGVKKLSAVEAFSQVPPKAVLPEDEHHYDSEEIACVNFESEASASDQENTRSFESENIQKENSNFINLPSAHALPEDEHHYDSEETLCIPSKDEFNQISHLKNEVLKQESTNDDIKEPVVKEEEKEPVKNVVKQVPKPIPKPVSNVFIKNEQTISFDDLPSFSDEELADETPEMMSLPINPKLENVSEIFIEKHKYAAMITSWKNEIDSLKKKTQAEKSFDHYDDKLQSLCTKANLSFARMQKTFAQAEKILLNT